MTITSANRVVILDPSWNPSVDAQAVDRVYRIGQNSNVVVYRLITCATVEEKIYRRQVFKDSVIRHTMSGAQNPSSGIGKETDPYRYFTRQELRDLFTLSENIRYSPTQIQLAQLHGSDKRNSDETLERHLSFVTRNRDMVFQISDHDLLFSCEDLEAPPPDNSTVTHEFAHRRLREGEEALRQEVKFGVTASVGQPPGMYAPVAGELFVPSKADSKRTMFNVPAASAEFVGHRFLDMTKELVSKRQSDPVSKPPSRHVRLSDGVQGINKSPQIVLGEVCSSNSELVNLSLAGKFANDASLEFTEENKNETSEPSLSGESLKTSKMSSDSTEKKSPHRFALPFMNTSTPVVTGKHRLAALTLQIADPEVIDLDLSQAVDDAAIENSVQMISLRKVSYLN